MTKRRRDDGPRSDASAGESFEEAIDRLEQIVKELEDGKKGLEDSIRLYEEGRRLVGLCTQRLDEAQTRIERLVRTSHGLETEETEASKLLDGPDPGDNESREAAGDDGQLSF